MRFFSIDDTDAGGGVANSTPEPSIAEIMAKQGVVTQGNSEQAPEVKPQPVAAQTNAEPAKVEPVAQVAEPKMSEPQVAPQLSWQEVLKNQQPESILKEILGFDDKAISFLQRNKAILNDDKYIGFTDHWRDKNGDVKDYLEALTTDYERMSDEEVMSRQLRQKFPQFTDEEIKELYTVNVVEKYKLDPDSFTDDEMRRGKILLKADAIEARNQFKAAQQQRILSAPPPPEVDNSIAEAEAAAQREYETYKSQIASDNLTKGLFAEKKFVIGAGEEAFNFPVSNPESYTNLLFDREEWAKSIFNEVRTPTGETQYVPDVQKQILLSIVAKHGADVFAEYGKHMYALGAKKAIEPIENPSSAAPVTAKGEIITDPAAAMAKMGRIVSPSNW